MYLTQQTKIWPLKAAYFDLSKSGVNVPDLLILILLPSQAGQLSVVVHTGLRIDSVR